MAVSSIIVSHSTYRLPPGRKRVEVFHFALIKYWVVREGLIGVLVVFVHRHDLLQQLPFIISHVVKEPKGLDLGEAVIVIVIVSQRTLSIRLEGTQSLSRFFDVKVHNCTNDKRCEEDHFELVPGTM